jgi:DNA polymerase-4
VERLHAFGFHTVGQLADADLRTLQRVVGEALGTQLHHLARGADPRRVTPSEPARSVSAEETFDADVDDPAVLRREVLRLADKVGRRLRRTGVSGRTVTLKVRFSSFETVTRSSTLAAPTDRTHDVARVATQLLEGLRLERARVRLVGVGVANLGDGDAARQLSLDTDAVPEAPWRDQRWEDVDHVVDRVSDRFGGLGVSYASLLDDDPDDQDVAAPVREDRAPVREDHDPGT